MRDASSDAKTEVPCGRCIGCRLERSRQWALRCMHEAKLHEDNCFVTLTYDDANLPRLASGLATLRPKDMQDFLKRLRKRYDHPIRFFQCGEYGDQTFRPHHHALLFGHVFPDQRLRSGDSSQRQYTSSQLDELWGHGFCTIDEVNFATAAYVARYSMKKVTGPLAKDHYQGRTPEFLTMSRRPGIATNFFDQFQVEIYNRDSCLVNGREVKPPKFYDNKLQKLDDELHMRIKDARKLASAINENNKPARLRVRERIATHKFNQYSARKKL